MPAQTTHLGVPYPLPDDAVVDYPALGAELANRLEGLIGPGIAPADFPPANPYDGQRVRLIVDGSNHIEWELVYAAANPLDQKWEFIGGPHLLGWEDANVAIGSEPNWSFIGPTITVPRAGWYQLQCSGDYGQGSAIAGNWIQYGFGYYPAGTLMPASPIPNGNAPLDTGIRVPAQLNVPNIFVDPALGAIALAYKSAAAGVMVTRRQLRVTPLCIG